MAETLNRGLPNPQLLFGHALRSGESNHVTVWGAQYAVMPGIETTGRGKEIDYRYYPDTALSYWAKAAGLFVGVVAFDMEAMRLVGGPTGFMIAVLSVPVVTTFLWMKGVCSE